MSVVEVSSEEGVLSLTLNRPERRNAMSLEMVEAIVTALDEAPEARIVVIRGAGGHFCSGGDIKDMVSAAAANGVAALNRRFGTLLERVLAVPGATVSVCEGAVMGGGFGLACVTDVTLAGPTARFRLPETQLGISPAQIAPVIVERVGRSQARRLAVTGETLSADDAIRIGLAHVYAEEVDATLEALVARMRRCEPEAVRSTKRLVNRVGELPLSALLDAAAQDFAALATRPEAQQGMAAFLSKEAPPWA